MTDMDDEGMTPDEFDRLMREGTPVEPLVALNRPNRPGNPWTTSVSHGGGWAAGQQRRVIDKQAEVRPARAVS